jgi:mono/diheme cytochrome c family protein
MTRAAWLFVLCPTLATAAADGAAIYRQTCAVAYCHGPEGRPGRAPGLAGRGLTAPAIIGIAASGIPNTSMPAFGGRLKPDELEAVAAYIVGLGGAAPSPAEKPRAAVPADVEQGRALFFDAARTGACGSCHEVGGRGIPVSVGLQDLRRARLADPRKIETPDVVTVRPSGESPFPAVVVEKTESRLRVYDLSSRLPVLRAFQPAEAELTPGSSWRHSEAASLYKDGELDAILRYLRWAAQ